MPTRRRAAIGTSGWMRPIAARLTPTVKALVIADVALYALATSFVRRRALSEAHLAIGPRFLRRRAVAAGHVAVRPPRVLSGSSSASSVSGSSAPRRKATQGTRRFLTLYFGRGHRWRTGDRRGVSARGAWRRVVRRRLLARRAGAVRRLRPASAEPGARSWRGPGPSRRGTGHHLRRVLVSLVGASSGGAGIHWPASWSTSAVGYVLARGRVVRRRPIVPRARRRQAAGAGRRRHEGGDAPTKKDWN